MRREPGGQLRSNYRFAMNECEFAFDHIFVAFVKLTSRTADATPL